MNIKKVFLFVFTLLTASSVFAQPGWMDEDNGGPKNDHLFWHVDLNYGNLYPAAVSSIVTGYLNYLMKQAVFETGVTYDVYHGKLNDETIKYREYSPLGVRARELFNTVQPGFKIGYKSNNNGNFNWGVYAMGHYKLDQLELRDPGQDSYMHHRLQYVKAGGGLHFTIGRQVGEDSWRRLIIEAGCQYSLPIGYKGYSHDKKELGKGISSHFALKLGGPAYLQDIGFFFDYDHFNTFNKDYTAPDGSQPHANNTLRNFTIGFQCSVTFLQGQDRR